MNQPTKRSRSRPRRVSKIVPRKQAARTAAGKKEPGPAPRAAACKHDALEKSLAHYMELYDSAPVAYLTLDNRGSIRDLNLPAAALLGLDRRALVSFGFSFLVLPNDQALFREHLKKCRGERAIVVTPLRLRCRDKPVAVRLISAVFKQKRNRFYRTILLETPGAERPAEAVPSMAGWLLEHIASPALVLDQRLKIWAANLAMARLLGQDLAALKGQELTVALDAWWGQEKLLLELKAVFGPRNGPHEFSWETGARAGQSRAFHIRAGQLERVGPETVLSLLTWGEVTLKRPAADLTAPSARPSEAGGKPRRPLDPFCHAMAHDLRAPLRAMQGFATALQEDYSAKLDQTGKEYLQRISEAAERMDRLILDLLEYSRLEDLELKLQPVPLERLFHESLSQMEPRLRTAGAVVEINKPLPEVLAHPATLKQVISHLLTNAVKFVPPGVSPKIRVRSEKRKAHQRIWIEDNGLGIAAEHQERIFQVFERLHGAERYPGNGIGLALARRAVGLMGGSIGVESELGKGSRFWIELRDQA